MSEPWWKDGLRFECTRCGACCRGSGRVEVSDAEIEALATALGLAADEFRRDYTRPGYKGRVDLRDQPGGDCIFFDERRGCSVYADRPTQCRTYPFWRPVLHSPESWEEEARHCEGIGRGAVVPPGTIAQLRAKRG